jgi:hypothetical protein
MSVEESAILYCPYRLLDFPYYTDDRILRDAETRPASIAAIIKSGRMLIPNRKKE